jgi:hypothetical protein
MDELYVTILLTIKQFVFLRLQFVLVIVLLFSGCSTKSPLPHKVSLNSMGDTATVTLNNTPSEFKLRVVNEGSIPISFYISPRQVNLFNTSAILTSVTYGSMTEAEKAYALWRFVADYTWHGEPLSKSSQLLHNPAMLVNSFGSVICDDVSAALVNLAKLAGLNARVVSLNGHVVAEIYYDQSWHMFDADMDNVYFNEDKSICSVHQLENNPRLFSNSYNKLNFIKQKMAIKTIGSAKDNYINDWYYYELPEYKSLVTLPVGGAMEFSSYKKFSPLHKSIHHEQLASYTSFGSYFTQLDIIGDTIIEVNSPYAIQQVELKTNQASPTQIYYSTNGSSWFYKGNLGNGNSNVTFSTESEADSPFTFHYFVKFKSSTLHQKAIRVLQRNRFVFSERTLFNNTQKSFQLVRTDGKRWTSSSFKVTIN